jgi:hypothetical protein
LNAPQNEALLPGSKPTNERVLEETMEYTQSPVAIDEKDVTHVMVSYPLPYCLYLDDVGFPVVINGIVAYVSLQLHSQDTIRGFPAEIRVPTESRLQYDRWGRQGHTTVFVSFPRHTWPQGYRPNLFHSDQIVLHSIQYVNKLIHAYKHIANEVLCEEVSEMDIISYECRLLDSKRKLLDRVTKVSPFQNAILMGEEHYRVSNEKQSYIIGIMTGDYKFTIDDELVLNSEAFFLKGQYELSVLFNAQSFEVFCKTLIRAGYKRLGSKTDQQLDKLLETPFANLVKDHLRIAVGFDFGSTTDFQSWDTHVRPVRNALSHGQRIKLSKDDAIHIISILETAKRTLKSNVDESLFVPAL